MNKTWQTAGRQRPTLQATIGPTPKPPSYHRAYTQASQSPQGLNPGLPVTARPASGLPNYNKQQAARNLHFFHSDYGFHNLHPKGLSLSLKPRRARTRASRP